MIKHREIEIINKREGVGIYNNYYNMQRGEWKPISLKLFPFVYNKTQEHTEKLLQDPKLNYLQSWVKSNGN